MRAARTKALFYLAVMMPLWSSYLVKIYAWKLLLAKEGAIGWTPERLGATPLLEAVLGTAHHRRPVAVGQLYRHGPGVPLSLDPVHDAADPGGARARAGILIEASGDLGATPGQTFRTVILPLALPGVVAGSIFTFSLTLGDYIVPQIVGPSSLILGQVVYAQQGLAGNIPLAAAFSVVPILIMGCS